MRSFSNSTSLMILAVFGLLFLAGPEASAAPPAPAGPRFATIKPGAAVEFSHRIDGASQVGDVGTAVVTVADSYEGGSLRLTARAGEGLELVSNANLGTISMTGAGKHVVKIRFRVLSEGVHYLSLIAEALEGTDQESFRTVSMRVQIGNAPPKQTDLPLAKDSKGDSIILMPATETTRN
jgi:hypothetical protein